MHSWQMTLHDMFKQYITSPNFCQKYCALNRNAYLNGCVLKQEITVEKTSHIPFLSSGVYHEECIFH